MTLTDLDIDHIQRIIAHTIIPKTATKDAYSIEKTELLNFKKEEKAILIVRLQEALQNQKKTFQLDYEDKSEDSIYDFLNNQYPVSEKKFISYTQTLSEDLASAHFRTKIPGGYCLIGEGKTSKGYDCFFVVKAELQEVFEIDGTNLKLIKDVFLSPAKDFYKVAFFIRKSSKFIPFMYDDQFSMQKKDLTEYFYGQFLGLTTDKNDSLKSKNFFDDTKLFIDNNINNVKDRFGLLKALKVLYREETSGLISAKNFSDNYFEGKLKTKYEKLINEKYPRAFTRDVSLIDKKLDMERISIPLSYSLSLVGNVNSMDDVEIVNEPDADAYERLGHEFNNGSIKKAIFIKEPEEKTA